MDLFRWRHWHCTSDGAMLCQRRRRWRSIATSLGSRFDCGAMTIWLLVILSRQGTSRGCITIADVISIIFLAYSAWPAYRAVTYGQSLFSGCLSEPNCCTWKIFAISFANLIWTILITDYHLLFINCNDFYLDMWWSLLITVLNCSCWEDQELSIKSIL